MRREENVTRTRWGETAGSPGGAGTYLERCLLAMIAVVAMSGLLRGAHAYTEDEGQRLMARAAPVLTYCRQLSHNTASPMLARERNNVFLACVVAAAEADNDLPDLASVADQLRSLR